jgi:hypothetical protein
MRITQPASFLYDQRISEPPKRPKFAPDDPRHSTVNGNSNHGCRCDRCKEANRLSHAEYI